MIPSMLPRVQFMSDITQIVAAAHQTEAFQTAQEFHMKVTREGHDPFVIESWPKSYGYTILNETREISITVYTGYGDDICANPDILLTNNGIILHYQDLAEYHRLVEYRNGAVVVNMPQYARYSGILRDWHVKLVAIAEAAKDPNNVIL